MPIFYVWQDTLLVLRRDFHHFTKPYALDRLRIVPKLLPYYSERISSMMTPQRIARFFFASLLLTGICKASEAPYFKEGERLGSHFVDAVIYKRKNPLASVMLQELMLEFFRYQPKSPEFTAAFSHFKSILSGFKKEVVQRVEPLVVTTSHKETLAFFIKWLDMFIASETMATFISNMGLCISERSTIFSEKSPYGHFRLPFPMLPNAQSPEYVLGESCGKLANQALILAIQEAKQYEFTALGRASTLLIQSYLSKNKRKQKDNVGVFLNALIGFEKGFKENNAALEEALRKSTHPFNARLIALAARVPLHCLQEFFAQQPLYAIVDTIGQEITRCGKDLEQFC